MGELRQLVMYRMVKKDDRIYFYNQSYGAIIEIEMKDMLPRVLWMENGREFLSGHRYGGVAWYEDKLVFAPRYADDIMIYGLKTGEVNRIGIDASKINEFGSVFTDVRIFGRHAFFFPGRYKAILRVDLETYEMKYIEDWVHEIGGLPEPSKVIFSKVRMADGNVCLLPCWQKGMLLEFDMATERWKKHDLGKDALADVAFDGSEYWLVKKEKKEVIRTDGNFNVIQEYDCGYGSDINNAGYMYVLEGGKCLYLLPFYGTGIIEWEKRNHHVRLIEHETDICIKGMGYEDPTRVIPFLLSYEVEANQYILFDAMNGAISAFNALDGTQERYPLILGDDDWRHVKKRYMEEGLSEGIMRETEEIGLDDFLAHIGGE